MWVRKAHHEVNLIRHTAAATAAAAAAGSEHL
jgi:hypothetical protein